jgi:hypothetical protein
MAAGADFILDTPCTMMYTRCKRCSMNDITPQNHPLDPDKSTKNNILIQAPQTTRTLQQTLPRENKETAIASSVIPWPYDDNKGMYLGYRACGFSVREALRAIGIGKSSLSNWRAEDAEFVRLEQDLPNIRKQLAKDYVELEFLRNFRLVLEKDFRVVQKSLGNILEDGEPADMSKYDQEYLLKMRGQYTVDQMKALEAIVGQQSGFSFTELMQDIDVVGLQRTQTETVMVRQKQDD